MAGMNNLPPPQPLEAERLGRAGLDADNRLGVWRFSSDPV